MTTGTAATGGPSPVKFSRLSRQGVLLGLSAAQTGALAVAVAAVVVGLYVAGGYGFVATSPLWVTAAGAALVPVSGRAAVDWTPVVAGWTWRRLSGRTTFRRRITRPHPAGIIDLAANSGGVLRQFTDPETGAVMVHDPHGRTVTAIVEVTHPGFLLQDPAEQQRRIAGWGRVLSATCRSGRVARIQILQRCIPDTGAGLKHWWEEHATHTDSWLARTYRELIERAGPAAERHTTTIAFALDLKAAARQIRAAGSGPAGAATVLRREMTTLSQNLTAAGLRLVGWYTPEQLAVALRTAYDPDTATTAQHAPQVGGDLTTAGPVAVDEHWNRLQTDSAHHAVLWISQWPQTPAYPGFLAPLLLASSDARRSFALICTPVRTERAVREIRKAKTEHLSNAAHRARIGKIEDARDTAEYHDVLQREAELATGHGLLHYTGLLTITAKTVERLEDAVAEVEQAALQAGCETRLVVGQQARAFTTAALPLARDI